MCINAPVSLATWITSTSLCIYIIRRNNPNDVWVGCILVVASAMQLLEFMMWMDQRCGQLNHIATKLAFVLLWLQPFVATSLSKWGKTHLPDYVTEMLIIITAIPFLYSIYYVCTSRDREIWCTRPGKNCHLIWNFFRHYDKIPELLQYDWKYFAAFIPLFAMRPSPKAIVFAGLLLGSFMLSYFRYYKSLEYGSVWCWVVNALAIVWIVMNRKSEEALILKY